ncbi:MAG: HYR domain-containing protein, partial [Bacteroidota bacterium]
MDSDPGEGARWALRTTTGGQIAWVSTSNDDPGTRFPQWETPGSGYFEALRNFAFNNLQRIPFDGVQTAGPASGSSFELGTTTLTFTGTDPSGNDATCSYNVTVLDTISPIVVCRDTMIALEADGMATLSAEDLLDPSTVMMVDNCPFGLVADKTTFTCTNVGNNQVVVIATDDSSNEGRCTATVTVTASDLACSPPMAICVETLTVNLDEDGNTDLSPADLDNGSSDAVTPDEDLLFSFDPAEGLIDCDDVGTLPVSLIVTNSIGRADTCVTQVTVQDTFPPVLVCQDITLAIGADGGRVFPSSFLDSMVVETTDNCGFLQVFTDTTSLGCANLGDNLFRVFVRDRSFNSVECELTLTISDPTFACDAHPTAICQETVIAQIDAEGNLDLDPADLDNGS